MTGVPDLSHEDFILNIDEAAIDRELADRSFKEFIKMSWHLIEPGRPFVDNWHIDAVCEHLESAFNGELSRLVINVPPSTGKSLLVSVFFPAWIWTKKPETKNIFASYSDVLSGRDSLKCRSIIDSAWYKERWGHMFRPIKNQWAMHKFSNDRGGFRLMTTVKGGVTGEHADIQVVDDPIKPLEVSGSMAVADNTLNVVKNWWDGTMSTRLIDFSKSIRIIIMQRLHEGDLAGYVLSSVDDILEDKYEHLMLPMEFEPVRKCFTRIGFEDPRTEEGELLFPERFPRKAVDKLKKELGSRAAEAQLQQNPTPAGGLIFKDTWPNYYDERPFKFEKQIQSWDCTFKEAGSSYVVGQVWGVEKGNYYLLDEKRDRMSFTETCKAVKQLSAKWPRAYTKLVEAKANGDAVVDYLKSELSGLILVEPEGGKEARANAVEPLWEAGNVYLPSPELCPWIDEWLLEILGFPGRVDDDRVDSMTQALIYLQSKSIAKLKRAMENYARG